MIIAKDRDPRLQIDDQEPLEIDGCEVLRDVEHSTLTGITRGGTPLALPKGARITLWAGPSVVFVGKAVDESHVLDLISTETDDELQDYESI